MSNHINKNLIPDAQQKPKKDNKFIRMMKSRKAKHGALATVLVALAITITLLLNIVTGMLVERYPNLQVDLTESRQYQLQQDTMNYINSIDKKVNVYIFADKEAFVAGISGVDHGNVFKQAERLLSKADAESDNLTVNYLNLSDNPTFTSKYPDVNWSSTTEYILMLVECGSNYTSFTLSECFEYDEQQSYQYGAYYWTGTKIEQALSTGVLRVTLENRAKVEVITGLGETASMYESFVDLLNKNAYDVSEISLTSTDISDDTDVVLLVAPSVDFNEEATKKLRKWLKNNGDYGKTLVYLPYDQDIDTPNLDSLLAEYGMAVSDGISFNTDVYKYVSMYQSSYIYLADYVENSPYLEGLKNSSIPCGVAYARDVIITDASIASPLLIREESVGVFPFSDVADSKKQDKVDTSKYLEADGVNPAAIGTISAEGTTYVESQEPASSHIVVFGSPYMLSTSFISDSQFNNANFALNVLKKVTNQDEISITITSAQPDSQALSIERKPSEDTIATIFVTIIPLGIIILGIVIYLIRRNR